MIKKIIDKLVTDIERKQIEIYNEFSLQHEVGILLRSEFPNDKVQFERNIDYFFNSAKFVKKEIDITVFSTDKSELRYAIELKFPRNGQYPEQMFSFCKDILFAEQMKNPVASYRVLHYGTQLETTDKKYWRRGMNTAVKLQEVRIKDITVTDDTITAQL